MPRTLQQPRSADGSGSELRDFDLTDYLGPKLTERAYDAVEAADRRAMKRFSRRVKDKRLKDRKIKMAESPKKIYYHSPKEGSTRGTDEQGAAMSKRQREQREEQEKEIRERALEIDPENYIPKQ